MSEKGGTKKSSAKKASGVDSASRVATIGGIWAIVVAIVAIIGLGSFIAGYNYGANGTIVPMNMKCPIRGPVSPILMVAKTKMKMSIRSSSMSSMALMTALQSLTARSATMRY